MKWMSCCTCRASLQSTPFSENASRCCRYLSAYKAIKFSDIELLATEDGSAVMAHWKATAFHLGAFLGTPASGKVQNIKGMSSFRIVDDKITRVETFREQLIHEQAFAADYGL